jgi:tetratricopeptide (TPR) repeat protein
MRLAFSIAALTLFAQLAVAQPHNDPAAIRINNRGVAEMGQQMTERAAATFTEAFDKDPKLAQAAINKGISLLYLQKIDEAKAALNAAIALDAKNPQAWYNLGLAQHADNELEPALASFKRVVELDPRDVDSYYYQGVCYQELKDFDNAIAVLKQALAIDPVHASAEFALARSLQRSGRTEEAKPHFTRFRHLTTTKISAAIGLAYGEQGHYSTVSTVAEPSPASPKSVAIHYKAQPLLTAAEAKYLTGPVCVLDTTGTGVEDLILLGHDPHPLTILHPAGDGGYSQIDPASLGLKFSGYARACAVGDYTGETLNSIVIATDTQLLLFHNLGHGKFEDATAASGLTQKNHVSGLTFLDYDHDGNLDLFITGSPLAAGQPANILWRNVGNKTFTDKTEDTGLGGSTPTTSAILTDFNNDRAVDIAVAGTSPLIYVNPREGKYPTQPIIPTNLPATRGIATIDYNKSSWMSVALTHTAAPGLSLWQNTEGPNHVGRAFTRVPLPLTGATGGYGLTPVDFDNDGWLDLAAIIETKAGPEIRLLRNKGDGSFEDISRAALPLGLKLTAPRAVIPIDENGAPSLLITQAGAPPILLHNSGTGPNHSVRIDLTGFADNKTAIESKVEIFAGGRWQKWEIPGASGYMSQASPHLLVGLGPAEGVDLIRILWPTGVLQDEIDLAHQPVIALKEADRRGSSCPVLFAWNGRKYQLVTDVIGAAVLGHWFTPTSRNIPRPDEWIKVPGDLIAPTSDGQMSLRFIEPMEEVNYVDQLRLFAIDHPANVTVNPDEKFLDFPPFASGRVIASAPTRLPLAATDGNGRNALAALTTADHNFASGFTPTPYDGFANLHALTLDLGKVDTTQPLRLLMTGYVNYFSATSLYDAWQAGITPIAPYAEAQLADGSWQKISGDLGFPAGLERTIVVDLTGKLPAGAHVIRLITNLEIYWDQALIDNHAEAQYRATELPLSTATLRFHGYPKQLDLASNGDLDYDYDLVSLTGPFQHQRGNYTRFGDVTPLLNASAPEKADHHVIFGSGEEIATDFETRSLPALPSGWTRDYFFYADGYVKDMDWWDALPFTVAQLPFHKMTSYPYPETQSQPITSDSLEYELNWNTRFDSGEPTRSYHFNFEPRPTTPANDHSPEPPAVK